METNDLFLTKQDLQSLTGSCRVRGQLLWLDQNGWTYTLTCRGEPRVARELFHAKMVSPQTLHSHAQPNWSAARRLSEVCA